MLKSEVARIYEIDLRTLNNWINEYPALSDELESVGYCKNLKFLTLKHVEIVFNYLGMPESQDEELQNVPIKSYFKKEIAKIFGIDTKTLRLMINNIPQIRYINQNFSKKYSFSEISHIFEYLGTPKVQKNNIKNVK